MATPPRLYDPNADWAPSEEQLQAPPRPPAAPAAPATAEPDGPTSLLGRTVRGGADLVRRYSPPLMAGRGAVESARPGSTLRSTLRAAVGDDPLAPDEPAAPATPAIPRVGATAPAGKQAGEANSGRKGPGDMGSPRSASTPAPRTASSRSGSRPQSDADRLNQRELDRIRSARGANSAETGGSGNAILKKKLDAVGMSLARQGGAGNAGYAEGGDVDPPRRSAISNRPVGGAYQRPAAPERPRTQTPPAGRWGKITNDRVGDAVTGRTLDRRTHAVAAPPSVPQPPRPDDGPSRPSAPPRVSQPPMINDGEGWVANPPDHIPQPPRPSDKQASSSPDGKGPGDSSAPRAPAEANRDLGKGPGDMRGPRIRPDANRDLGKGPGDMRGPRIRPDANRDLSKGPGDSRAPGEPAAPRVASRRSGGGSRGMSEADALNQRELDRIHGEPQQGSLYARGGAVGYAKGGRVQAPSYGRQTAGWNLTSKPKAR